MIYVPVDQLQLDQVGLDQGVKANIGKYLSKVDRCVFCQALRFSVPVDQLHIDQVCFDQSSLSEL
jgi:hypothetical protein